MILESNRFHRYFDFFYFGALVSRNEEKTQKLLTASAKLGNIIAETLLLIMWLNWEIFVSKENFHLGNNNVFDVIQ